MKSDILKLYESSKNLTSFFSALTISPKNKMLKEEFDDVFKKTVYFKDIKKARQQTLYNIMHDINEYPTYSDGGLKIFKNLEEGYYSEEEYNLNKCKIYISRIKDKKYLIPALFHIKEGSHSLDLKNNFIIECLKDIFGEDYDLLPKDHIFNYLTAKETRILRCKICR